MGVTPSLWARQDERYGSDDGRHEEKRQWGFSFGLDKMSLTRAVPL